MGDGGHATVRLDGASLTIDELVRVARDPRVRVEIVPAAMARVEACRAQIEHIVKEYKTRHTLHEADPTVRLPHVYGVTTGFGEFKDAPIPPDELVELQQNLLLSHAVGIGDNADEHDPANYFAADVVRGALLLRLNAFLKGHSGVRREVVECVAAMLNAGVIPLVPTRGSVGSSGDLCPLSHLFVTLLGKGSFYIVRTPDDLRARSRRPATSGDMRAATPDALFPATEFAKAVAAEFNNRPIPQPSYKEGLALANGCNFSGALLALSVYDAERLALAADVAVALTVEAVCGRTRAFDESIAEVRPMRGHRDSAANLRTLLTGSKLVDRAASVQDAYSIRCAPQVHGASRDAIAYAAGVAHAEINAATDNPLFFPDGREPWDIRHRRSRGDDPATFGDMYAYSAGNFHGQPLALAADFLAIAVAELADISERRTQLLLDRAHNRGLPANLISRPGVQSGYMIAQYAAAGLVSENKVLAHPASVDSIPTSANSEDHNSMATIAARKLRTVLGNTEAVLAIELLAAAQAIDWRVGMEVPADGRPGTAKPGSEDLRQAREVADRFAEATSAARRGTIAAQLGVGTRAAYLAIRDTVPPLTADLVLEPSVRTLRARLADGGFVRAVVSRLAADEAGRLADVAVDPAG